MHFKKINRRRLLKDAAALTALGLGGLLPTESLAAPLRLGQPAPEATLISLNGTHYSTHDLLGRVVVLTFWATWCLPCRRELPALSTYAARQEAAGLTVLGFSLDDTDQYTAVHEIAQTLSFPVGFFNATSAPGYGRIWRMPANFTIDREGKLADNAWDDKQEPGWTTERLERVLSPLLQNEGGQTKMF